MKERQVNNELMKIHDLMNNEVLTMKYKEFKNYLKEILENDIQ